MRKQSFRRSSLNAAQSPEPRRSEEVLPEQSPPRDAIRRTQTNLLPGRKPSFTLPSDKGLPSIQALASSGSMPSFAPAFHSRILSPSATLPPTLPPTRTRQYSIKIIPVEEHSPAPVPSGRPRIRRGQSQEPLEPKHDRAVRTFAGSHLADTFLALDKAQSLQKPSEVQLNLSRIRLPPPRKPRTVILDLEDTLVHICEHKSSAQVILLSAAAVEIPIKVRPYAQQCLTALHKHWEVIVFASSPRDKAEAVLDFLDPQHTLVDVRLFEEHALQVQGTLVKDLRLLSGRDLKHTVIVDNTATSFAFQIDNAIPIKTWRNSMHDKELLHLLSFADELAAVEDVRYKLRSTFDLRHFCQDFAKAFKITQQSNRLQG